MHPLLDIRGWHRFKKKWYYLNPEDSSFRIKLGAGFNVLFDKQPEPKRLYKLSFFTGVFDCTRRKIYQGDLLQKQGDTSLYEVFFDSGRFQARVANDVEVDTDLHVLNPAKNGYAVVGDVYSTPGLLGVDNDE